MSNAGEFKYVPTGDVYTYRYEGQQVYVDKASWFTLPDEDGLTGYYTDAREFESYVASGCYAIINKTKVDIDTVTLAFYYVGRQDSIQKAVQTEDGFKVSWNSFVGDCFYSTDQVRDFIAAGNWVVVGVE